MPPKGKSKIEPLDDQIAGRLKLALEKGVPRIHVSGFANIMTSNGDVIVILESFEEPAAVLVASPTTAKTLVEKLNSLIQGFDGITGVPTKTADEVRELISAKRKT